MYDMTAEEALRLVEFRQNNIDWLMYDIEEANREKEKLEKVCFQLCRDVRHGEIYRRMGNVVYDQIQQLEEQVAEMWSDVHELELERDYLWAHAQECAQEQSN